MPKKSFTMFTFFVVIVLGVVLPAQTTFALDAPTIAPTRLDFDASHVPKACNDDATFRYLLETWIAQDLLSLHAERHLIVRIRRSPTGGKLADLTLVDAVGTTIDQDHKKFASNTECYKVLYETARAAAKLLGAFDKPPPPEPIVCPICPACSFCPACPTCPTPSNPPPRIHLSAPPQHRFSLSAGVFLGMTTKPNALPGPYLSLSVVPFSGTPDFRLEFDGAWTSWNPQQGFHVDMVPVFASLCHAHHGLRLCSGLVTTFFMAEQTNHALDFTLSASLRMGTEFGIAGPLSIRADVFALLPLTQRTPVDSPYPLAAGVVAMGVWSFE